MQPFRTPATAPPPGPSQGQRVMTWSALGAGSVLLVGGSALYGWGLSRYFTMAAATEGDEAVYTRAQADRYELGTNVGIGMLAGGAVLAGGGLLLWRSLRPPAGIEEVDLAGSELALLPIREAGAAGGGTRSFPGDEEGARGVEELTRGLSIEIWPVLLEGGAGVTLEVRGW